jgi:hypothetical protein
MSWTSSCVHVPGLFYSKDGKRLLDSKSVDAVQAYAWVRDGRLSEVSAVYDGATPGAQIAEVLRHKLPDAAGEGRINHRELPILVRAANALAGPSGQSPRRPAPVSVEPFKHQPVPSTSTAPTGEPAMEPEKEIVSEWEMERYAAGGSLGGLMDQFRVGGRW